MIGALTLVSGALAQDVVTIQPTMEQLGELLVHMEERQVQLTGLSIGVLFDEPIGASFPIALDEGVAIQIIGLGDPGRMANLDLVVFDETGAVVASDREADNMPMLDFQAPHRGLYDVRVVLEEAMPGHEFGFYTLAVGHITPGVPVPTLDPYGDSLAATLAMEAQGLQPVTVQWRTIAEKGTVFVQHDIPSFEVCTVFAGGAPSRTRQFDLFIGDPDDQPRAHSRKDRQRAFAMFEPDPAGSWIFAMRARRLKRGLDDTHGVLAVGCR